MRFPITLNNHSKLLYMVMCLLPAVDMINGYLMREAGSSYSFIIKGILLIFTTVILSCYDTQSILWMYISCGVMLLLSLVHLAFASDASTLWNEVSWSLKYLYFYITYRFFRFSILKRGGSLEVLFFFAYICLVLNSLISFFGLGYSQYEFAGDQVGSRGLFYAGNELGALLIIVSSYVLHWAYRKNLLAYLACSSSILFCSSQIASKATIIGTLLLILFVPLLFLISSSSSLTKLNKPNLVKTLIVFVFAVALGGYSVYYVLYQLNLFSRIVYFAERFDVVTLLFSYRNVWASDLIDIFLKKASIFSYFLGMSYSIYSFNSLKTVEIDFVDIFLVYGICGLLVTYGFLFKCLFKISRRYLAERSNRSMLLVFSAGIVLLTGVSVTAGHVFNSSIASTYLAGLLALALYQTESYPVK